MPAPVQQYRPSFPDIPAGQWPALLSWRTRAEEAFRKAFDFLYDIRDNRGPLALFTRNNDPAAIAIPAAAAGPGNGIGLELTLPRGGNWLITGTVCLIVTGAGDLGQTFLLSLNVGPITQVWAGVSVPGAASTLMLSQQWQVTVPAALSGSVSSQSVRLMIVKRAGGGTSSIDPVHSTLSAVWTG